MKSRKLLLFLVLPLTLLLGLYVLAMLPSVQTAVALRAAAQVPGLTLNIERLSLGWSGAEVRGLEANYRGNTIRIPRLEAEYSGPTFLLRRELRVQRLSVPEFVLLAASGDDAPAPLESNPAVAFAGFLAPITLPFPIAVDSAQLAGRVALPAGRTLQLSLSGRLLAPGAEATPALRLDWANSTAAAGALRELHWSGQLRIRETATGAISRLGLDGVLAADAAAGTAGRGLRLNLDVHRAPADGPESLEASVRLPAARPDEAPLFLVQVEHRPGAGRITGDWKVRTRRDQLIVLAPDATWPEFTAEAQGQFSVDSATGDFSTTGQATAGASQLGQFQSALAGLEGVSCQVDFAVERSGDEVKLAKLEAVVNSGRAQVLRLAALQPASYRIDTGAVIFAQPENDLLRIEIAAMPVSWLQPLLEDGTIEGREIVGTFAVGASADGQRVVLRSSQPLVLDALTVRRSGMTLLDRARISLSPRIEHDGHAERLLVPDLLLTTAAGDRLEGTLDLNFDSAARTLGFAGTLRGALPTLLRPFSPVPLGALQVEADVAGAWRENELALRTLKAALRRNGGAPLLAVSALQPLTVRLSDGELVPERPGDPAARVECGGVPLAWAQPWISETTLGGTLVAGDCRLQGAGRDWTVETLRPFAFSGVRVVRAGRLIVDGLAAELALRVNARDDSWAVEQFELKLNPGSVLPGGTMKLGLTAKQDAAGNGMAKLPLSVDVAGRSSQLGLEATWNAPPDGPVSTKVRLSGDTVHLRDLAVLGGLLDVAPPVEAAVAPTPDVPSPSFSDTRSAKDTQPFWSGFMGRLDLEVQRLVLESDEIAGLQAVVVCDAQQLALEKLVGRSKNAPLDAKLGITFAAADPRPYALQGSCTFPGFDLGAFLRSVVPGEEPTLETVLDIQGKLEGRGANLATLLDGVRGDFVLKGGPGVLRIKDKRVEAATALGGLVLGLFTKEKQKPAVAAGSQLLDELREFRFERFDASLLRAEDMNLQVRTLDLRAANKRLTGSGSARHIADRSVTEYPLQLEMRLAGKDDFAYLLDQASLLDGTKDELGYLRMREPFVVGGTLVKPDWKRMLLLFGAGLAFGK